MFIVITLNHVRAVKAWAEKHGGSANLDLVSFELEIKAKNRFYKLMPQFKGLINGKMVHIPGFSKDSKGFIGWLPYRPLRWPLAVDKLAFKSRMRAQGILTPDWWLPGEQTPGHDYIFKKSVGSFGYEIRGPLRQGSPTAIAPGDSFFAQAGEGVVFAERFIPGRIVKAWFWGDSPFHLQLHDFPAVVGDGQRTITQLLQELFKDAGLQMDTYAEMSFVTSTLAFQQLTMDDVLAPQRRAWIDFRYGREFSPENRNAANDNKLDTVAPHTLGQLHKLGWHLGEYLKTEFPAPVQYSVDGVLDEDGNIWWLEMNSNPIFPPTGYSLMLDTLFGVDSSKASLNPPAATGNAAVLAQSHPEKSFRNGAAPVLPKVPA
jgi:hypothetical protein